MAHVHHHHHDQDDDEPLTTAGTQRVLVGIVVALAAMAVVGLVLLWPDGDRPALAEELGMGAELVDATVTVADQVPCTGTTEDQGIVCEDVQFHVTKGSPRGRTDRVSARAGRPRAARGAGV